MSAYCYIMNQSAHDYSLAKKFADELVFLTKGRVDRFAVNNLYRLIEEKMANSQQDDYILITSLPILAAVATAYFVQKHNCLNLLLYKSGQYIERRLVFEGGNNAAQGT